MRFRLFRSRAFWLGVPGLVFLLWGWWVSMGNLSGAGIEGLNSALICQFGGEIYVSWNLAGSLDWRDFTVWNDEVPVKLTDDLRSHLARSREMNSNFRYVFIPYHWLVAGYVAGWTGLLIWRKRKYELRPVG